LVENITAVLIVTLAYFPYYITRICATFLFLFSYSSQLKLQSQL